MDLRCLEVVSAQLPLQSLYQCQLFDLFSKRVSKKIELRLNQMEVLFIFLKLKISIQKKQLKLIFILQCHSYLNLLLLATTQIVSVSDLIVKCVKSLPSGFSSVVGRNTCLVTCTLSTSTYV